MYLNNLGFGLRDKYMKTGATMDLEEAISYHELALRLPTSPTITRIIAGRQILQYCAILLHWQQAYEASETAVHFIPKLTSRSLENSDKQHMLGQVVGLASDAAAVALHAGKGPLVALEFLENGRGVLAASLEEMRTDVLSLQKKYPELAEQFLRLREELELPVTRDTSYTDKNRKSSPWQAQASRRYAAGNEFDELVVKIRKQPEFEDFMIAPTEEEMRAAAKEGPIIAINSSEYRCDAILVEQQQIRFLPLPKLNNREIEEKIRRNDLGSPKVLKWLWDTVTKPILDALGFTQPPPDGEWPRVWWIPTGPLSRFPLHAAGQHAKGSSEAVLDRIMSSYGTSVKAIIQNRQRPIASSASNQALLVAMEHTPGSARLPFATKEVAMIHGLCKSMALEPVEPGRRTEDVISHLPRCKIFHFAGHGHTDGVDPSQSRLLLEDGDAHPLTVATLLEMNIRQRSPFLAYLSACGTGQLKDEMSIDESIHLISACQLAGFRHVIGTLWEVNDDICVDAARITYEGMRDGGITDKSVCWGLHNAARELRDRWINGTLSPKARRSAKRVKKEPVHVPLVEDKVYVPCASDMNYRDARLQRDIVSDSSDDEVEKGRLRWVPYVHFGV